MQNMATKSGSSFNITAFVTFNHGYMRISISIHFLMQIYLHVTSPLLTPGETFPVQLIQNENQEPLY